MQRMKKLMGLSLIALFSMLLVNDAAAQKAPKLSKEDKYTLKLLLKIRTWKSKELKVNGRKINVKKVMGDVLMDFYIYESKNKKTGKKEKTYKHKIDMAGSGRIFDFNIKNDSLQFIEVNGWNDYEVKRIDKTEVVIVQQLDNREHRWVMVPNTDAVPKKKKKKKK
ncbi:MAG: hypothetical protein GY810_17810 [Aureispira sp.]|nr:hypothetical protein [Aureispira sp.]